MLKKIKVLVFVIHQFLKFEVKIELSDTEGRGQVWTVPAKAKGNLFLSYVRVKNDPNKDHLDRKKSIKLSKSSE